MGRDEARLDAGARHIAAATGGVAVRTVVADLSDPRACGDLPRRTGVPDILVANGGGTGMLVNVTPNTVARYARILAEAKAGHGTAAPPAIPPEVGGTRAQDEAPETCQPSRDPAEVA